MAASSLVRLSSSADFFASNPSIFFCNVRSSLSLASISAIFLSALSGVEEKLATELLASMKKKAAAKILDELNKQKAATLSKTFATIQLE